MVFGVFDGLHAGHRRFLRQAKRHGDKLIAVAAREKVVYNLKGKKPRESEVKRLKSVSTVREVDKVLLGDRKQGSYRIIKKYKPDIICLGYDQGSLEKDLREKIDNGFLPKIKLIKLGAYHPKKFKSSILKNRA